eukprot:gene16331-22520_t
MMRKAVTLTVAVLGREPPPGQPGPSPDPALEPPPRVEAGVEGLALTSLVRLGVAILGGRVPSAATGGWTDGQIWSISSAQRALWFAHRPSPSPGGFARFAPLPSWQAPVVSGRSPLAAEKVEPPAPSGKGNKDDKQGLKFKLPSSLDSFLRSPYDAAIFSLALPSMLSLAAGKQVYVRTSIRASLSAELCLSNANFTDDVCCRVPDIPRRKIESVLWILLIVALLAIVIE